MWFIHNHCSNFLMSLLCLKQNKWLYALACDIRECLFYFPIYRTTVWEMGSGISHTFLTSKSGQGWQGSLEIIYNNAPQTLKAHRVRNSQSS